MKLIIFQFILLIKIINTVSVASNRIDQITNGWIEQQTIFDIQQNDTQQQTNKVYTVKCNKHSILNSNSSLVYSISINANSRKWLPVNGLQSLHLSICARICRFQARLTNGNIKLDIINLNNNTNTIIKQSSYYIDLIETSKIKYECDFGFHLRIIPNSRQTPNPTTTKNNNLKNKRVLIEKCQSSGIEEFVIVKRKSNYIVNNNKVANSFDEYYDTDYYADLNDDENSDYYAEKSSYSVDHFENNHNLNTNNENNNKHLYECVKYCKQIKQVNYNIHNGYLVPASTLTRVQFSPGEQIKFYCKEGFATDLTRTSQQYVSNMHTLECSINGTWHLVLKSVNKFPSALHSKEIIQLSECISVDDIFKSIEKKMDLSSSSSSSSNMWLTNSLSYSELNMRTFSMIFAICGLIILILLTSLLTLKFLKRKQINEIVFNNYSPQQLDPLLANTSNNNNNNTTTTITNDSVLPEYTLNRTREIPIITSSLISNNYYLPTYQEAIQHSSSLPVTTNTTTTTTTTTNSEITQPSTSRNIGNNKIEDSVTALPVTSSQINPSCVSSNRSRSNSIRSNLTTRSGSIRTTHSIATTNSFNMPSSSHNNKTATNNNSIRSKHRHQHNHNNQLNNKRQTRTNRSNTTATNISMLSNDTSNASIKGLRGSSNGVDLVSNNSSSNLSNVEQLININTNTTTTNTTTNNTNEDDASNRFNLDCNNDINEP